MTTERRRALLIGSPLGGLQGIATDIAALGAELRAWGFETVECVDRDATRDGILGALDELVEWAQHEDDAIAIYYTGHGGRCRVIERPGAPQGPAWSYLVPMDHRFHERFRGIAEFELAARVATLAVKTTNVTVILDCCHAATMVRGSEAVRAIPELDVMPEQLEDSLRELLDRPDALHPEGHPDVVRIVATASGSPAFELRRKDGAAGYLTTELCAALAEARQLPQPWDAILGQVRERVIHRRQSTTQRPELEGPRRRLPFSLHELAHDGERNPSVLDADGRPWLRAGRLHGLREGDRVQVQGGLDTATAAGRIVELFDDAARLELAPSPGTAAPRIGRMATPTHLAVRKSVYVEPAAGHIPGLLDAIERSTRLWRVDDDRPADFVAVLRDEHLQVPGPSRVPRPATPEGAQALVADLDALARAEILLSLLEAPPGLAQGAKPLEWEAQAFVTEPGCTEPRPLEPGETLRVGTRIYVEVRHCTKAKPTLYVNVLSHGLSGRLALVNQGEPAGVHLRALDSRWVGRRYGGPPGTKLAWPADVPRADGARESLIVVASQRPLDLRSLLEGPRPVPPSRAASSRSAAPAEELRTPLRWTVRRIDYGVHP